MGPDFKFCLGAENTPQGLRCFALLRVSRKWGSVNRLRGQFTVPLDREEDKEIRKGGGGGGSNGALPPARGESKNLYSSIRAVLWSANSFGSHPGVVIAGLLKF